MLTAKVEIAHISNPDVMSEIIFQATGAFHKMYNNAELMMDASFIKKILDEFPYIDKSMYEWIVTDVKTKKEQSATIKENKLKEISDIEELLLDPKLNSYKKYKLKNKLAKLKRNIDKDPCFGGKDLLRSITKHKQEGNPLADEELKKFRRKRQSGVYLVGRANEKGNRKVEFHLDDNYIIFKPNKHTHITIKFSDKRKDLLSKLQKFSHAEVLPLTVRIDGEYIYISYDETILSGYRFDRVEYNRTVEKENIKTKEGKKELAKIFHEQNKQRMLKDKIETRYAAIDTNPKDISLVIGDGDGRIILKRVYDLSVLCKKSGLSSDDKKQKYNNNKRKTELHEIWKDIFTTCSHYKVFNFVTEDLNFKQNKKDDSPKEFNRLTKNVWHRNLSEKLIQKWCNLNGLKRIEVNAAYSSFIGNMIHEDYDPIAAARELLRRGINKYIKGSSLYPDFEEINQEKLTYLLGENTDSLGWIEIYKQITSSKLRYRNRDKKRLTGYYLGNPKSKVKVLCL